MAIVRWDPFRDLMNIHERVSRLLSDAPTGWNAEDGYGAWIPPVDIFEQGEQVVLRAELPGVDRDHIDIRVENGVLTLKGRRLREGEINDKNAYRLERVYGSFSRTFALPTTVDAGRIEAKYRDGVLEVVLPKLEEAKPKKIQIQVS